MTTRTALSPETAQAGHAAPAAPVLERVPLGLLPAYYRMQAVFHEQTEPQMAALYRDVAEQLAQAIEADQKPERWLTVPEVAERLQLTIYTVREYARLGRLGGARKTANVWRFRESEFRLLPVGGKE